MQLAFSFICFTGMILLLTQAHKIRETRYWPLGWLGYMFLLALSIPAIATMIDVI